MATLRSFDGISLWYDDAGEGFPVLLLHGVMSDSQFNWVRPGIAAAMLESLG